MLRFDRVMWYGFMPATYGSLVFGLPVAFGAQGIDLIIWGVAAGSVVVAHFANTARLVRRRRLWRP